MKCYKFGEYSVRFHKTGGVTICDKTGEHEVGHWSKAFGEYHALLFDRERCATGIYLQSVARVLLQSWYTKI